MTPIALWLLLGAPAPCPMPTTAPARLEPLVAPTTPDEGKPAARPFLRPGVRVVAGAPASAATERPEGPPLP